MYVDKIRVQYRKQRREIIRMVISEGMLDEKLTHYIQSEAEKHIPLLDQKAFIEDIHEDLMLIDPGRIALIGITPEQLMEWLQKRDKAN